MTNVPSPPRVRVRLADHGDHEAIHRLNYRTFVEEIPQHPPRADRRLVDRFHDENIYAVYESDSAVVGMVSARIVRPFSLDAKLGSVDRFLPSGCHPAEVRLLAVEPAHRSSRAFTRLVAFISAHLRSLGFDTAVASGTTRQLRLYRHLGFTPFGPLVGSGDALYQPMYLHASAADRWPAPLHHAEDRGTACAE